VNTRDYDYIENRLLDPLGNVTEACGRLRQVGRPDLADRVMRAAQEFTDECRAVRRELQGQRGTR
jgi:hypothetical protein